MLRRYVVCLIFLVFTSMAIAQSIEFSEVSPYLLRGTTCGATTSFPTMMASATSFRTGGSKLLVPEALMTDFLGDVTVINGSNATIPADPNTNEIFKVGLKLQEDVDNDAANLKYKINIPGSGERDFVDSDTTVVDYLKQKWFVDQQLWNITDPDEQTQRVKDAMNCIRGKHNLEEASGGPFRNRTYVNPDATRPAWTLGEIFGKPIIVSPPKMPYTELAYQQFIQSNANRATVMFFAAGDGMIHGVYFDGPDQSMNGS